MNFSFDRIVPSSQRSFALAFQSAISRALGSIPGPLLFGAVLDYSCLLRQTKCNKDGGCNLYSGGRMALYMALLCGTCFILCGLSTLGAWKLYKPPEVEETNRFNGNKSSSTIVPVNSPISGHDNPALEHETS